MTRYEYVKTVLEPRFKDNSNELYHHGILGMKWGIRRFQNEDGSLTSEGKRRYYQDDNGNYKKRSKQQIREYDAKKAKEHDELMLKRRAVGQYLYQDKKLGDMRNAFWSGDSDDDMSLIEKMNERAYAVLKDKQKDDPSLSELDDNTLKALAEEYVFNATW